MNLFDPSEYDRSWSSPRRSAGFGMTVVLTERDRQHVVEVALDQLRELEDRTEGNQYGRADRGVDRQTVHVQGQLAEAALRRWAGITRDTTSMGKFIPDVGLVDVRSTPLDDGHLIVHEDDPSERRYVLMVGSEVRWTVRGWAWGYVAQRPEYWASWMPHPCFAVPQDRLATLTVKMVTG